MRIRSLLAALLAGLLVASATPALAESKSTALSPAQEKAVRKLVRDYLFENPEIIIEAMQKLREKRKLAERQRIGKVLASYRQQIYENPQSPIAGNPKGDVTIVEFFDYQCGYCKSVMDRLLKTVRGDGNIRLVFKEFPILGPNSVFAARAALASRGQKKYFEFHELLMGFKGKLSREAVFALAKSIGLDTKRLARDMNDPKIKKTIARNFQLAQLLKINGTPAFIIGDKLVPGALSKQQLEAYIAGARDKRVSAQPR
ncbi:MAG: DsbA family protein [Alphaproteobacteria bacterium]